MQLQSRVLRPRCGQTARHRRIERCTIRVGGTFPSRCYMIRMASIEQVNERRISRSMQTYLEGEERCGLKWIRGIIGPEIPLARKLFLDRFGHYKNTPRYCDLEQALLCEPFEFTCDCDSRYLLYCRAVAGPLHFFP